jgi:hypothetical protein
MEDELFTREEVISGGLSRVRRARALLYLIEQEASRVTEKRSNTMAMAMGSMEAGMMVTAIVTGDPETMRRELPGESDAAFIESFRNARRTASPARAQTLAKTTPSWKVLVPDNLALSAEVLHQMSLRHVMPANRSKSIMKTFGVGTTAFDEAYRSQTGSEVGTAFGQDAGWLASWRRRRSANR